MQHTAMAKAKERRCLRDQLGLEECVWQPAAQVRWSVSGKRLSGGTVHVTSAQTALLLVVCHKRGTGAGLACGHMAVRHGQGMHRVLGEQPSGDGGRPCGHSRKPVEVRKRLRKRHNAARPTRPHASCNTATGTRANAHTPRGNRLCTSHACADQLFLLRRRCRVPRLTLPGPPVLRVACLPCACCEEAVPVRPSSSVRSEH